MAPSAHFFMYLTAAGLAQSVEHLTSEWYVGCGFDSRGRTNNQGLKITEK